MSVKIISLEAESAKKIKAVSIKFPQDGLVLIGGKNKSGKTSTLDLISYGIGGESYRPSNLKNTDVNKTPYLRVELSNGIVAERKGKNSSLNVTDSNGKKSGQTLLNEFVSSFALDIGKFLNADAPKKRALILKALGNEEKLLKLNADEKTFADDRTLKGRECTRLENVFNNTVQYPDAAKEKVSREEIALEYKEAIEENGRIQDRKLEVEKAHKLVTEADLKLDAAKKNRDSLKKKLEEAEKSVDRCKIDLENLRNAEEEKTFESELDSQVDIIEISTRLQNVDAENKKIESNENKELARIEFRKAQEEYEALNNKINEIREGKKAIVDIAKTNLPGLEWNGEELVYNGQHWDGMSGAEQMIVATSICEVLSPNSKFVLIDKLEQMDSDTLKEFGEWALSQGLQAIGSIVSTGGECTIVLEDGEVKS